MPTLKETALKILALPREAGTPEAAKARELVATYLTALGYTVVSQRFTFAPSSLRAFPIFGAGLGGLALVLFPFLSSDSLPAWAALAVWMSGLVALAIVADRGRTGVGAPRRRPPGGRQPDRHPGRAAAAPVGGGASRLQGPGPLHGRPAGCRLDCRAGTRGAERARARAGSHGPLSPVLGRRREWGWRSWRASSPGAAG